LLPVVNWHHRSADEHWPKDRVLLTYLFIGLVTEQLQLHSNWSTASNFRQIANLLYAKANSASYP